MDQSPPATIDPANASYKTDVLFIPQGGDSRAPGEPPVDGEEVVTLHTGDVSRQTIRKRAYAQMKRLLDVETREDVDAHYELKWTSRRFHDPPWETADDLETSLSNLDGVRRLSRIPASMNPYRPPYYRLAVEPGDEPAVEDAVHSYYPGLITVPFDGSVAVIFHPIREDESARELLN